MSRLAVVLFNLGGPDRPESVRPFLFNLFNDKAIIGLPALPRRLLAAFIAWRRAPHARSIYARIGGRSPLLDWTHAQAEALERLLESEGTPIGEVKVFIAMRYWHPLTAETVAAVRNWGAERILLLPLYPQFSSTTGGSSLNAWKEEADRQGLQAPVSALCCYPEEPSMIAAWADLLAQSLDKAGPKVRVLFSAHGLPKKIVAAGDPYQEQVERTARAIVARLGRAELDWRVSYQSRVGPLEWLGPPTDQEIRTAGREGLDLVVLPIAFVSEHSETLVELDMDYAKLAASAGVERYVRVPALNVHEGFIRGLADLARRSLAAGPGIICAGAACGSDQLLCPRQGRDR